MLLVRVITTSPVTSSFFVRGLDYVRLTADGNSLYPLKPHIAPAQGCKLGLS